MRAIAIVSGGVFLLAASQQVNLPTPLARHYDNLKAASSLTIEYTVQPIGESAAPYKLVFSRDDSFRLTTPSGYVVSDGKTVTTYKTATKTYTQEAYTPQWLSIFVRRPDVLAWGAFLGKEPKKDVASAQLGAARTVQGSATTEVQVSLIKPAVDATWFVDQKLGVVRGWTVKSGGKELLVVAKTITVGKEPLAAEQFAFVAPEGAKKEEPATTTATYADVQAIMTANCLPCHGGANPRGGIGLTNYQGIVATVVPGQPAASLLVKAVKGVGARKMPPGNHTPLNDDQTKLIEAWILAGAKQD